MTELFFALLLFAIIAMWWWIKVRQMRDEVERMEHRFRDYGKGRK